MSLLFKQVKRLPKDVEMLPTGNFKNSKYFYEPFVNMYGENVYLRHKLVFV